MYNLKQKILYVVNVDIEFYIRKEKLIQRIHLNMKQYEFFFKIIHITLLIFHASIIILQSLLLSYRIPNNKYFLFHTLMNLNTFIYRNVFQFQFKLKILVQNFTIFLFNIIYIMLWPINFQYYFFIW